MPIFATNAGTFSPLSIKGIHATGSVADFLIENSLRFDSDISGSGPSFLAKTPTSAGSRTTWTWSAWVKLSSGDRKVLFASVPNEACLLYTSDAADE